MLFVCLQETHVNLLCQNWRANYNEIKVAEK